MNESLRAAAAAAVVTGGSTRCSHELPHCFQRQSIIGHDECDASERLNGEIKRVHIRRRHSGVEVMIRRLR